MSKVLILMLLLLILLSACAVMDLSSQETAVPLSPKKVEIAFYEGMGLELGTIVDEESPSGWEEPEGWLVTGLKLGVSVSPKADLVGKVYISGFSWGGKVGVKVLARHEGKNYLSVVPSFTAVMNTEGEEDGEGQYTVARSLGGEAQLLSSWVLNEYLTVTLGARGNYSRYRYNDYSESGYSQTLEDDIFHGALLGNVRLSAGPLYLIPEIGYEAVPVRDEETRFYPICSLGLGLKF